MSQEPAETTNPPDSLLQPALLAFGTIALLVLLSLVFRTTFQQPPVKQGSKTPSASAAIASPQAAVAAVKAMYDAYLPMKVSTYAAVGDNPAVEPAAVQVLRANNPYFASKFYNATLKQYMTEYQATGKVASDAVACFAMTTSAHSESLLSRTKYTASVAVTLPLADTSTKNLVATVDLHDLKVSNVSCQ